MIHWDRLSVTLGCWPPSPAGRCSPHPMGGELQACQGGPVPFLLLSVLYVCAPIALPVCVHGFFTPSCASPWLRTTAVRQLPGSCHPISRFGVLWFLGRGRLPPPVGTLSGEGESIAFCISFALDFVVDCCTFWLPNPWEVVGNWAQIWPQIWFYLTQIWAKFAPNFLHISKLGQPGNLAFQAPKSGLGCETHSHCSQVPIRWLSPTGSPGTPGWAGAPQHAMPRHAVAPCLKPKTDRCEPSAKQSACRFTPDGVELGKPSLLLGQLV
jgi:hypothetical protein